MSKRSRTGSFFRANGDVEMKDNSGTTVIVRKKKPTAFTRTAALRGRRALTTLQRARLDAQPGKEIKYLDTFNTTMQFDATGAIACLNQLAEGSDNTQRVGRKIMNLSLQIKGFCNFISPSVGFYPCQYGRLLVVWDKTPQGNTPAITDILTNSTSTNFTNINNKDRFVILRDHGFFVGPTDGVNVSPDQFNPSYYEDFIKLNLASMFGNTTAVTPQTGGLILVSVGTAARGTGNGQSGSYSFVGSYRLKFTDD